MMKKLKHIILHVGPDKTGTTAIQKTLYANAEQLERLGVLYVTGHVFGKNDRMLSIAFCETEARAKNLFNADKEPWENGSKQYLEQLQRRVATTMADILVLSYEGLVHLNKAEFKSLYTFLHLLTEDVCVVMYVREPASYAISALSQRVKTGRRAWLVHPPVLKYRNYLRRIISVFGRENINVRLFDPKKFPSANVVLDFLSMPVFKSLQQLSNETLEYSFEGNPSFSETGILVGDRIVEILGSKTPAPKCFRKLFMDDLYKLKGRKLMLSSSKFLLIKQLSACHTKFLRQEFDILFPEFTFSQIDALPTRPTSKELESLARDLIAHRLPNYRISWFRRIWRMFSCWCADALPSLY